MTDLIWAIISALIVFIMFFCNRKVRLGSLIRQQFKVFTNDKSKKISFWDLLCFLLFPIILSAILIFALRINLQDTVAETLTTVFSLIFTILFRFATILMGKSESANRIEKKIIEETFVSIISATVLSLIATIMSICITVVSVDMVKKVFWCGTLSISFMIVMLILLIIKRSFVIYCSK